VPHHRRCSKRSVEPISCCSHEPEMAHGGLDRTARYHGAGQPTFLVVRTHINAVRLWCRLLIEFSASRCSSLQFSRRDWPLNINVCCSVRLHASAKIHRVTPGADSCPMQAGRTGSGRCCRLWCCRLQFRRCASAARSLRDQRAGRVAHSAANQQVSGLEQLVGSISRVY